MQQHSHLEYSNENMWKELNSGIAPDKIYQQPAAHSNATHSEPVKTLSSSSIYGAVYSGVPVYEMMCRNVAVMRRKDDSFLNATQILKVAGIDKGKRTKILEKEIINGEHEKVQGGYGKYQGTWIPFDRGVQLAAQFNVDTWLAPILEFVPPSPGKVDCTPSKEQVLSLSKTSKKKSPDSARKVRRKSISTPVNVGHDPEGFAYPGYGPPPKRHRMDTPQLQQFPQIQQVQQPMYQPVQHEEEYIKHAQPEEMGNRHRATLMAMFLSESPNTIPEILLAPVPDLDVNIVIDDQGHTALHWAAALARIDILRLLISKGGDVNKVNYHAESALIRSVLVTNNFDNQTFPELLLLLSPSLLLVDHQKRSVFHHIALTAASRGRGPACRYYLECILEYMAKNNVNFSTLVDNTDICGDTAVNLAARIGSKALVEQLLDVGANPTIENLAGLKPSNFGFGSEAFAQQNVDNPINQDEYLTKDDSSLSTRVVFPSIATDHDQTQENRENTTPTPLEEAQAQLKKLSREIVDLRNANDELKKHNRRIPELEENVRVLSNGLEQELSRRTQSNLENEAFSFSVRDIKNDGSLDSLKKEILYLRSVLARKDVGEQDLRKEIINLRSSTNSQEFKCKRIISACCGIPMENIQDLLDPLLKAIETDDPMDNMDLDHVKDVMTRLKQHPFM